MRKIGKTIVLFLSLPFMLVPARHRLGLIDADMQTKILEARKIFSDEIPSDLRQSVEFFSLDSYNAAASIQDNILFGKTVYGQADASNNRHVISHSITQNTT